MQVSGLAIIRASQFFTQPSFCILPHFIPMKRTPGSSSHASFQDLYSKFICKYLIHLFWPWQRGIKWIERLQINVSMWCFLPFRTATKDALEKYHKSHDHHMILYDVIVCYVLLDSSLIFSSRCCLHVSGSCSCRKWRK